MTRSLITQGKEIGKKGRKGLCSSSIFLLTTCRGKRISIWSRREEEKRGEAKAYLYPISTVEGKRKKDQGGPCDSYCWVGKRRRKRGGLSVILSNCPRRTGK